MKRINDLDILKDLLINPHFNDKLVNISFSIVDIVIYSIVFLPYISKHIIPKA